MNSGTQMIKMPGMLMIGAAGRAVGKTELACSLIRRFADQTDIVGVKVTTVQEREGQCPRGGKGCGICSSLDGDYRVTRETRNQGNKDTSRLLAAGATRVFWLRVLKTHLRQGFEELRARIGDDALVICESNSLRSIVEPDVFLMVRDGRHDRIKPSAQAVSHYADRIVRFDGENLDLEPGDISLFDNQWNCRRLVSAIVLTGGNSTRMGQDKSRLTIGGKTLIQRLHEQLRTRFAQVILSTRAERAKQDFPPGLETVPDRENGRGPLMGISCALEASRHDLNLVVACDIPDIDMELVNAMLRAARDCDVVVPKTTEGFYEPLFAVYRRNTRHAMRELLEKRENRVVKLFDRCRTAFIDLGRKSIRNLNTPEDYREYRRVCNDDL